MNPEIRSYGAGRYALTTLVVGDKFQALFAKRALPSWERYCRRFGFDLVIFRHSLDESPRGKRRSPAWQKCLVADDEALKRYTVACWVDADIIVNDEVAPSVFESVPAGTIGAVEAWASPTVEAYKAFTSLYQRNAVVAADESVDDDAAAYYSKFGLPAKYDTVVQTGVIVFEPQLHGPVFRHVYDHYEDRGAPWWHYEMRPLSFELHQKAPIAWLDPRFNYNAICDIVAIQGQSWPNGFTLLDKIAIRLPWVPFLAVPYRKKLRALKIALDRAWFPTLRGIQVRIRARDSLSGAGRGVETTPSSACRRRTYEPGEP